MANCFTFFSKALGGLGVRSGFAGKAKPAILINKTNAVRKCFFF